MTFNESLGHLAQRQNLAEMGPSNPTKGKKLRRRFYRRAGGQVYRMRLSGTQRVLWRVAGSNDWDAAR